MLEPTLAEKARREGLKAKRDMLFAEYLKNPSNTRLAVEIKMIDDDIANSVEQMERLRYRK
jgi:ribosomal protein L18E